MTYMCTYMNITGALPQVVQEEVMWMPTEPHTEGINRKFCIWFIVNIISFTNTYHFVDMNAKCMSGEFFAQAENLDIVHSVYMANINQILCKQLIRMPHSSYGKTSADNTTNRKKVRWVEFSWYSCQNLWNGIIFVNV